MHRNTVEIHGNKWEKKSEQHISTYIDIFQRISILNLLLATLMWLILPQAMSLAATYYVAPKGNDQWSGTLPEATNDSTNGPFKTIEKARDTIRQLKSGNRFNEPVDVILRGGTYFLDEPFNLTQEDSGTKECPITYKSYPGQEAIISGGKILDTTWQKYNENIYVTNVGTMTFNSLFVDGKRATRAREPDTGYFIINGVDPATKQIAFDFKDNDIDAGWSNLQEVEVIYFHAWTQPRMRIDRVVGNTLFLESEIHKQFYSGGAYYVENVFEGLDEPGEWFLDKQTGGLYYWPLPGEAIENLEIIVPIIGSQGDKPSAAQLLEVKGNSADYIQNLVFNGIVFAHTDWFLEVEGYMGWQSAWFIESLPPNYQRGVGSAVSFKYSRNCEFSNNTITHVGGHGLTIYAENMHISCNVFTDIGATGMKIGTWDPHMPYSGITGNNVITDNTLTDTGTIFEGAGIFVMISGDNIIAHNLIHDIAYTGISVGWGFNDEDTASKNNIVEYNDIYRVMQKFNDGAGIYLLGKQPGTIIRNNLIHDINHPNDSYGRAGLYIDEGGKDIILKNNWVYRTNWGLQLHSCSENTIENNTFVSIRNSFFTYNKGSGNRITKNIVYSTEETRIFYYFTLCVGYSDYNLFYSTRAGYQENWDNQLQKWRTNTGFDMNSIEKEPLFVDYANDDFNLMPQSPAFGLGFKQIDMSDVGLRAQDEATPPKGDLNLDGQVNIQDVQCCVNHISGTQDWGNAADINKDGEVNEDDVKEIVNIILSK